MALLFLVVTLLALLLSPGCKAPEPVLASGAFESAALANYEHNNDAILEECLAIIAGQRQAAIDQATDQYLVNLEAAEKDGKLTVENVRVIVKGALTERDKARLAGEQQLARIRAMAAANKIELSAARRLRNALQDYLQAGMDPGTAASGLLDVLPAILGNVTGGKTLSTAGDASP
jgi:hypothetical protein